MLHCKLFHRGFWNISPFQRVFQLWRKSARKSWDQICSVYQLNGIGFLFDNNKSRQKVQALMSETNHLPPHFLKHQHPTTRIQQAQSEKKNLKKFLSQSYFLNFLIPGEELKRWNFQKICFSRDSYLWHSELQVCALLNVKNGPRNVHGQISDMHFSQKSNMSHQLPTHRWVC